MTTLTLIALGASLFGLDTQERNERQAADTILNSTLVIVIDGKIAAQAKPARNKPSPGTQTAPSQIKVLLPSFGKGGGDVAMEEMTFMSPEFEEWIMRSMRGDITLKRGVVGATDIRKDITIEMFSPDGTPVRTLDFSDAFITEIGFPSLSASNKDPAYMTIKIGSDNIVVRKKPGRIIYQPITLNKKDSVPATKKWNASDFKIEIGDLPCSRVSKIDSITWKQKVVKDEVGSFREPKIEQTRAGTQNLKITLPMSDWNSWEQWMTTSLLSKSEVKKGSITVLSPDKSSGYSINFLDVTIVAMAVSDTGQNIEDIKTFDVELHYKETDFNFVSRLMEDGS